MTPTTLTNHYKHYRFPTEISSHGVWLYYRFCLSYCDVEELLFARGVTVTYEAIRKWCRAFGQRYAHQRRRRRPRPGDQWHLDEVFLSIHGQRQYLWRTADQDGHILDILVQSRRKASRRGWATPPRAVRGQGACGAAPPPETEQAGITHRQVRTDVEQRLREGGIRVLTPPELLSAFGLPTLAATLRLRPAEPRPRALSGVHVSVALKQRVLPERNMAMPAVEAATWEAAVLGVVGPDAGPRVREDVATLVDRFVQAYRAVNPTPAAPTPPHPSDRPVPGAALIRQAQERIAAQGFHPGLPDGQMGAATPASPPAVPTCPRALPSRGNWMTSHNGHSASNSSGESSPTGAERRRLSRR